MALSGWLSRQVASSATSSTPGWFGARCALPSDWSPEDSFQAALQQGVVTIVLGSLLDRPKDMYPPVFGVMLVQSTRLSWNGVHVAFV